MKLINKTIFLLILLFPAILFAQGTGDSSHAPTVTCPEGQTVVEDYFLFVQIKMTICHARYVNTAAMV